VQLEVTPAGERAIDNRVLKNDARDASRRHRSSETSIPPRYAVPLVGSSVVVSIPIVVDLPAPFGPSSPKTSPRATSKLIPFTASTPPS